MSSNRPNILVIMSDTHATWATGCYGSEIALTPNIDRLAAEGICFDRAYSQNPICVPCRQSLVTGQYSFQCGVLQNDTPMPELYTMAHHLGKAGYDTASLGKMHFIPDTESSLGKERHHGFTDRIDYEEFWHYLRNERGCPPVEGHPDDPWQVIHLELIQHALQRPLITPSETGVQGNWGTLPHEDHQEYMVLNAWEEYLAQERENPFFTFVSFQSPHGPSLPTPECLEPFLGDIPLPDPPLESMLQHPVWHKAIRNLDEERRREWTRYYYAFANYTDWCVGEALRLLDESGKGDNTLVIYLSDHGDMGFNHGLMGKTQFYEESVRVPLVMHKPDTISAGQHHTGLVELIDLFPTFCDVAGTEPPELSGRSLWSDICNQNYVGKDAVYSESYPMTRNVEVFGPRPHRMVLTDEWKLIQYGDICVDLFDVQKDQDNHHNLANDPEHNATATQLLHQLNDRLGPLPTEDVWR